MNTPPRKRRRRRPQQESTEEGYESPRRRKKKSSSGNKKKKKSTKPEVPVGLIAAIAGTVVVVIAFFVVDWKGIGQTVGVSNTPESLMKRSLSYQNERIDILASIKDEASARAAGPRLIKIAEEMARTSSEMIELQKAENIPLKDSMALRKEFDEKFKLLAPRLVEEMKRIGKNPALAATVKNLLNESGTAGMKVKNELRFNRAKKEANADGYSAVTSSTELTSGMRIQVLGPFGIWTNGVISDVRNDGKVKVPPAFQYMDRDRLRIPD